MVIIENLQTDQSGVVMKPEPGTYALILQNHMTARVQIGRWRTIDIQPGYYTYVGSAFGPGGVQARVSRHCRTDKSKHWHIDYLRTYMTPAGVWISYERERLEHQWAQMLLGMAEMFPIHKFGCSDCNCSSHLFHAATIVDITWRSSVYYAFEFDKQISGNHRIAKGSPTLRQAQDKKQGCGSPSGAALLFSGSFSTFVIY